MQENELKYYEKIANWDFSDIKYKTKKITNWDFYEKIKENTNKNSICLDLGTGGGEKVLKYYPKVKKVIGTDFSKEMIQTANKNLKKYPEKNVEFKYMDSLNIAFPKNSFDVVSARHTIIDAEGIYKVLKENGVLVIEGIDKKDCIELKDMFGRGQAYKDKISIADIDYINLKKAGFSSIEKIEILEDEYYETKEDLLALLLKVPILDDFSETEENNNFEHINTIEKDIFDKYIQKYTNEKGILLKRVLYGIVAKK